MKIEDFKIIGSIQYGDFALVEYMYNEIVIEDTYGLRKLKASHGDSIKTIIDIGGNLGVFSAFAREIFPQARIISLEAVHDTFISLKENLLPYNVETYNMAFGDGSELFFKKCEDHSGANQFKKEQTASNISIKSKTLSQIFTELKIEGPYVIKMDIEGSEMFLYEDAASYNILRGCEYFTMEYHNVNMLGFMVDKPMWDQWLIEVFNKFNIEGLGGNATGATYRIKKNG
jgi:FkbM family methyltransferase